MIFELMHKNIPVADTSLNEEGRMEHILAIRDLACVLSFRDADNVNSTGPRSGRYPRPLSWLFRVLSFFQRKPRFPNG